MLWNVVARCKMLKTSWQMGEHPFERRFGEPFEGPVIPFGAMVEYHPISGEDQSRFHQFVQKVLAGIFVAYALIAGRRNMRPQSSMGLGGETCLPAQKYG